LLKAILNLLTQGRILMKEVSPANNHQVDNAEARKRNNKRRILWLLPLLLIVPTLPLWSCTGGGEQRRSSSPTPQPTVETSFKLWDTATPPEGVTTARGEDLALRVKPGSEAEARAYYLQLQQKLVKFPRSPLTDSAIADMLVYYGFPALLATDLQALSPAVLMDFAQLRNAVSNKPEFNSAYSARPLQSGEILVSRFFAPKIINVRDPQTTGVPQGGFGWRKVLRFQSRAGSPARNDGLDTFYLLFNFADNATKFPEGKPAGQIQALLVPTYPTGGKHNDIYFLVYEALNSANPGKVGLFLVATFDLAGSVPDDRYFVPTACGQCHGTEKANQPGGKVNYLDTDHWIDRTGDDFPLVKTADVLVDSEAQAYDTIRILNTEIEKQNSAVIAASDPKFALLAGRKWLELHKEGGPNANRHVAPLLRGFAEAAGDPIWTAGADPDEKLLPMMNQYCFRCHSSVRFHVFQKQEVIKRKSGIIARVRSGNMPQDRKLTDDTKKLLIELVEKLP
jgi:hypothetical protein